jgi:hypothetical protein
LTINASSATCPAWNRCGIKGYLTETIGSLVKLLKSMPEGVHRNRLLDEISKLDVIAGGIKKALDVMEE